MAIRDPETGGCPGCGESLTTDQGYSKATLVEIRGVYDGGLFYAHPKESGGCGFAWHRWIEPNMRKKAQAYIDRWNERANHVV